jgi:hypothetical protein
MDESQTKRMWLAHLGSQSEDRIEAVLIDMIDHHPTFPPTLGEFKKMLRLKNEARPELSVVKRLPAPEAKKAIAKDHLERMRAILR